MNRHYWIQKNTNELTDEDRNMIASLKDQHWKYGISSQLDWMEKNLSKNDIHLLGFSEDGLLIMYLTLTNIGVTLDSDSFQFLGVGNVCVDKINKGKGYGRILMEKCHQIFNDSKNKGILLCKDTVVGFYSKCGWTKLECNSVIIDGKQYNNIIMMQPCYGEKVDLVLIEKNF